MTFRYFSFLICIYFLLTACSNKTSVDYIVYNATIYTVDSVFSTQKAMAVKNGKVVATGSSETIFADYDAAEKIDIVSREILIALIARLILFFWIFTLGEAKLKTKLFFGDGK